MFTQYDEYQRLMRYKNGYYAFHLMVILMIVNMAIVAAFDQPWAEDSLVEFSFILAIPLMFMNIRNTWQGSQIDRREKPFITYAIYLLLGLSSFWIVSRNDIHLIQDGLVSIQAPQLLFGLVWFSTPFTYLVRYLFDRFRSENK